jgi:hypothetical protein
MSEAELEAFCRDVLAKYSREDIALFLIRLRKAAGMA